MVPVADEIETTRIRVAATSEQVGSVPPDALETDAIEASVALDLALQDAQEQSSASREILLALGSERGGSEQILDTIIDRAKRLCRADVAQLYLLDSGVFRLSRMTGEVSEDFRRYLPNHPMAGQPSHLGRPGRAGPADPADRRRARRPGVRPAGPAAAGRLPHPAVGADDARRRGGRGALDVADAGGAVQRARPEPRWTSSPPRRRSPCARST